MSGALTGIYLLAALLLTVWRYLDDTAPLHCDADNTEGNQS